MNHGATMDYKATNGLLVVKHVPIIQVDGRLQMDEQTCNSLIKWAKRFERIVFAGVDWSKQSVFQMTAPWKFVDTLPCAEQIEVLPLPFAYRPERFLSTYARTRQLLRTKMAECQYLCAQLGSLFGEWGGVLCLEAQQQQRPYAVWLDRVEHEVSRRDPNKSLKRRLMELVMLPLMEQYHYFCVRRAQLGLFQGRDCYDAFSPYCANAHCVYIVHNQASDQISPDQLDHKLAAIRAREPLKICYVGRASGMKGPMDWLQTLHHVQQAGVPFKATWLGDGELLPEMKQLAETLGIADRVSFPGFVGDRTTIYETLRHHHLFLFCHKTPESPRCLIEAMVSGCPLVGYQSLYQDELVAMHGGGLLTPLDQWQTLAEVVVQLDRDREKVVKLTEAAAETGRSFDEAKMIDRMAHLLIDSLSSGAQYRTKN
jgi:glycosyltransferase involved in cell wall biosynthesis